MFKSRKRPTSELPSCFSVLTFFWMGLFLTEGSVADQGNYDGPEKRIHARQLIYLVCKKLDRPIASSLLGVTCRATDPNTINLPERVLGSPENNFVSILTRTETCVSNIHENPPNESAVTIDEVLDLLSCLEITVKRILGEFERERALNNDFGTLIDTLSPIGDRHIVASEWPPKDYCSGCPKIWRALSALKSMTGSLRDGVRPLEDPTLSEVLRSLRDLDDHKGKICYSFRELTTAPMSAIEERFKYYSWTKTRDSYDFAVKLLREAALDEWCQP